MLKTWTCNGGNSSSKDECSPNIGDGKIVGTENCDDMNTINQDGCSNGQIDSGYTCTGSP